MSIRHGPHDYNYKATFIDREDYTRVEREYTRGKVLGGSTAVNYYTWLRGSAATIDEWKDYGGDNWSWENTKDYFDKPATYHDDKNLFPESLRSLGNQGGPIHIAHPHPLEEIEDWRNALEKAWVSKGQDLSVDVYHGEQKGLFRCVNTVYNGVRSNASFFVEGKSNISPFDPLPYPNKSSLTIITPLLPSLLLVPTTRNIPSLPNAKSSSVRALLVHPNSSCFLE
jgi:choline dehydrogenase